MESDVHGIISSLRAGNTAFILKETQLTLHRRSTGLAKQQVLRTCGHDELSEQPWHA